jgi:hypothetical protein
MARPDLRQIGVASKIELKQRLWDTSTAATLTRPFTPDPTGSRVGVVAAFQGTPVLGETIAENLGRSDCDN